MKQCSTESPDSVTGNAARSLRFVADFASVGRFTPPSWAIVGGRWAAPHMSPDQALVKEGDLETVTPERGNQHRPPYSEI